MCGIFFSLSPRPDVKPNEYLRHALWARGPDCMSSYRTALDIPWPIQPTTSKKRSSYIHLHFVSTCLNLRGTVSTVQPLVDSFTGCCLAWNGEAWKIGSAQVSGNDSLAVFSLLLQSILITSETDIPGNERAELTRAAFVRALNGVIGPFSFVFYDTFHRRVFFGRDRLGRRSLMFRKNEMGEVTIASVSDGEGQWIEVKADGVYELELDGFVDVKNRTEDDAQQLWTSDHGLIHSHWQACLAPKPRRVCSGIYHYNTEHNPLSRMLLNRNVESTDGKPLCLLSNTVALLEHHLKGSLSLRVQNIPNHNPMILPDEAPKVAVLFSGGVDCAVLARIAHDILPQHFEIDLLNVAFENPRTVAAAKVAVQDKMIPYPDNPFASCPDRLTGLSTYDELRRTCTGRLWRFVSIDISYAEFTAHRDKVISLMYPHNTEMDLSIACALYFAARGQGVANVGKRDVQPYTSPARVLLSGLGADELFAGYTRHATAFHRRGKSGLFDELDLDVRRLSERNLGRDDRIIGQWGKELRYPYLDETLITWAMALPLWEKCGFGKDDVPRNEAEAKEPNIEAAKKVLRLLAWKLGMTGAAMERKRAIQFGARTAKMTTGKIKGTEIIT